MNIGILIFSNPSANGLNNQIERLVQSGNAMGHTVHLLYQPYFTYSNHGTGISLLYKGEAMPAVDVILSRPNFTEEPSLHTFTTDLLRQAGYTVINGAQTFSLAKNKLAQRAVLMEKGVAMPRWSIVYRTDNALQAAEKIGFPVIVKVAFGTFGKGVFYAPTPETLMPITDYLSLRERNPLILEEFISEANRTDLRVFVLGGKVIAAMQRNARPGDVRANASIGGTGTPVTLTDEEVNVALRAAEAFGLEVAGVDILRSKRGPLVIEVNANPGFQELEKASGVDVAKAMIEYTLSRVAQPAPITS